MTTSDVPLPYGLRIEERLAAFDDDDNRYYQGYIDALRWALALVGGSPCHKQDSQGVADR